MPKRALPTFIEPMLAAPAEPFDSDAHLFEVKWDGFRALAFVESGGYRLLGRRSTNFTTLFPELSPLAALPDGTVLDGEVVAMVNGKPDFAALLRRNRSGNRQPRKTVAHSPVTFVAFDLLFESFQSIQALTCEARRSRLEALLARSPHPRIVLSRAIVGAGRAMFEQTRQQSLEGVIAKRRDSPYEPGRRSGAWMKFKARQQLLCAIIGYQLSEPGRLRSLIIAAPVDGELRWVGKVGSGINASMQARLLELLRIQPSQKPMVDCNIDGNWVVPDVFCRVSFLEWTNTGKLRGPVFESLYDR